MTWEEYWTSVSSSFELLKPLGKSTVIFLIHVAPKHCSFAAQKILGRISAKSIDEYCLLYVKTNHRDKWVELQQHNLGREK